MKLYKNKLSIASLGKSADIILTVILTVITSSILSFCSAGIPSLLLHYVTGISLVSHTSIYLFYVAFVVIFIVYSLYFYRYFAFQASTSKIVILLSSLTIFGVLFFAFKDAVVPNHAHDASNHITRILYIREHGKLVDESFQNWYYPAAYHLTFALTCPSNVQSCVHYVWKFNWIIASLFPLSIFMTSRALKLNNSISLFATFFSTTFYMFPYSAFGWGGFSIIAATTISVIVAPIIKQLLNKPTLLLSSAVFLMVTTVVYIHPATAVTLFLLALLISLPEVISLKWFRSWYLYLTVALILIVSAGDILHSATVIGKNLETPSDYNFAIEDSLQTLNTYLVDVNYGVLIYGFFMVGLISMINRKNWKNTSAIYILFILFSFLIIGTKSIELVIHILRPIYPWGMYERLTYPLAVSFLLLAGAGASTIINAFPENMRKCLFIALLCIYIGYYHHLYFIRHLALVNVSYAGATADDMRLFERINQMKLPGARVLVSKDDGGEWIEVFTELKDVNRPFTQRIENFKTLEQLNLEPEVEISKYMSSNDISYIYKGARQVAESSEEASLSALLAKKNLKVIANSGSAYLFEVSN